MAASSDHSVIEGLLCPICLQDQQTIQQLQEHYESAHSGDLSITLKSIFAKAKRKILKQDATTLDQDDDLLPSEKKSPNLISQMTWGASELGEIRRHTDWFRKIRTSRHENYTTEANKLIIRLGRLLEDPTVEPDKRKAYEKNLVSWVDDSDVKLCPGCAKNFNLARRRHHCRLCGAIMCQPCSCFIDHDLAKKLVRPGKASPTASMLQPKSPHRRDSLMALMAFSSSAHNPDNHTRVCVDCFRLLERRTHIQDQKNPDPSIQETYQLMKNKMTEVDSIIQTYEKVYDSLMSGERKYSLEEGKNLRAQITRGAEMMDLLSRKLGAFSASEPADSRAAQLQKNIRKTVSHFLQSYVLTMPPLPTAAELQQVQQPGPSGWTPDHERPQSSQEGGDPLLEQINNIRNYLGQAKRDRRMDEVAILESNLRELEAEYANRKATNSS